MRPGKVERLKRAKSRRALAFDQLDGRLLLATTGHTVGPFIAPAVITPRVSPPASSVSVQAAINNYLAAILGEEQLRPIQAQVHSEQTGSRTVLTQRVLEQPFVRSLYTNRDMFTLLNSPAISTVIGVSVISDPSQTDETVRYLLPTAQSILSIEGSTATVQIPPNQGIDGFIAEVPTTNLRLRADGIYAVDVPRDQVPANAPPPLVINVVSGALQSTFQATGPILANALLTGAHRATPNAPRTVPGLRLSKFLGRNRAFPGGKDQRRMWRQLRVAVSRNVLAVDGAQQARLETALGEFLTQVDALNQSGAFTPLAPPVAPTPIRGPLTGTLLVSTAAIRDLSSVPAALRGLPLGEVTDPSGSTREINLRGRIDAGYAIDRDGDFGLVLTARGPLLANPTGFASKNMIGGDIRIEVSSARNLEQLAGLRVEEGLTVGAALESTLGMSNSNGISTWSVSVGYGSGFQYGTSVSFTTVIPLGNINALLPQAPP